MVQERKFNRTVGVVCRECRIPLLMLIGTRVYPPGVALLLPIVQRPPALLVIDVCDSTVKEALRLLLRFLMVPIYINRTCETDFD